MADNIASIIITIVGSGAFFSLVQFLVTRHDNKKGIIKEIKEEIRKIDERSKKAERDNVRLQLLTMISDYPDEEQEIMAIAKHYFEELHGNWYMTEIFGNYVKSRNLGEPEWYISRFGRK